MWAFRMETRKVELSSGAELDVRRSVQEVLEEITRSTERSGRAPGAVRLLAVTKTISIPLIVQALDAGVSCLGENRVQEAVAKQLGLSGRAFEFHLIGPLQSNKVNKAVACFDWIETVDSPELAQKIDQACSRMGKRMPVLVQVNVAKEPSKAGVFEEDLFPLLELISDLSHISFRGLMTIPPLLEDPEDVRPYFGRMRSLIEETARRFGQDPSHLELSMGMSHDYPVAIEEGSTLVRVGTAIFGERYYH
jgi:PLP dependent protein